MKIEFLYFEGCPNHALALALLKKNLAIEEVDQGIEMINVDSVEIAQKTRFLGSPSIRINGKDIETSDVDLSDYGMKCRIYIGGADPTGIPPENLIIKSITEEKGNN